MRRALITAIICLIVSGCKNKENNSTDDAVKAEPKHEINVTQPKAIVTESNQKEFDSAVVSAQLFRAFNTDTITDATIKRPPVEIVTQFEKLKFKNINPAFDKGFYDEDEIDYFNLGFSSVINKHLVYAGYYEYEELLLVDHITAKADTLIGLPHFSPDAKRIASYNIDPYGDNIVGDVEVFAVSKRLTKLFKQRFDFIPVDIRWANDNSVIVKAITIKDYTGSNSNLHTTPSSYIFKKITVR